MSIEAQVGFPFVLRNVLIFCPFVFLSITCSSNVSTRDLLDAKFLSQQVPLAISPRNTNAQVGTQIQFSASGGTPPYSYTLVSGIGSLVLSATATYIAPQTTGAAVVSVTDKIGNRDFAVVTVIPSATKICPTGYILVPANTIVGTTADFCVAKYEMKCPSDVTGAACTFPAISQIANQPWVNITQTTAATACGALGTSYHLITNQEWLTIARNVELVGPNWNTGSADLGTINYGHSDGVPGNSLAASTDDKNCYGTGQGTSDICSVWNSQVRTHRLSNGEVIWDFSGNVQEWTSWQVTQVQKAYISADGGVVASFREWTAVNANVALGNTMEPKTWQANNTALNSGSGIGQYQSGFGTGAAVRSGAWGDSYAGIYMLDLAQPASNSFNFLGFRCTYQ